MIKEKKIIKKLKKIFPSFRKLNCQRRGIPDGLITIDNEAVFIEIKNENEKLTALQEVFLKKHYKNSFVIRYKEGKFFLEKFGENFINNIEILINEKLERYNREQKNDRYNRVKET